MGKKGKLYGIGLGPGDSELITLKALKAIKQADVVAYHQAKGRPSQALAIAQEFLGADQVKLPLIYPITRQLPPESTEYQRKMQAFYNQIATQIATHLECGQNVSVLVAGDPLLYSSFLPIYQRLTNNYETIIIPGIMSAAAAAAATGLPLCQGNESFTFLSALMPKAELLNLLQTGHAFAILKLGPKNFDKVRNCLQEAGRESQALYIEAATQAGQKILNLAEVKAENVPYFSLILVGA